MSSSLKSTRCGSNNQIDIAVFHWYVGKRSQNVPIDRIILKEKALEFMKTFQIKELKAYYNSQNPLDLAKKVTFCEIDWDKVQNFVNYRRPYGSL